MLGGAQEAAKTGSTQQNIRKSCGISLAAWSHVILTINGMWICWELDIIRNFKKCS